MSMKVVVRQDLCESNAVCIAQAPHVFELDEDGIAYTLKERVDGAEIEDAEAAVFGCPREAITLIDEE